MAPFDLVALASGVRQPGWRRILLEIAPKHADVVNEGVRTSVLEVYPSCDKVFEAFNYVDVEDLKVIIVGQDCYQNPGLANGLAFSVPNDAPMPPSLRNIFKELEIEFGEFRRSTELYDWAGQGVLLLNRSLTVQQYQSNSHAKYWLKFTEELIEAIHSYKNNVVYMLWGNFAQNIESKIDVSHNLVLKWTHPSPLSRKPFVGNNHFRLANEYLKKNGISEIHWI